MVNEREVLAKRETFTHRCVHVQIHIEETHKGVNEARTQNTFAQTIVNFHERRFVL